MNLHFSRLELRIPPPIVALLAAVGMWLLAESLPYGRIMFRGHDYVGGVIALAGGLFDLAGLWAFRTSRTTINPLAPQRSSALVSHGIYSITRNPMYVGLAVVLVGWAVALGSLLVLVGVMAFALYIQRFQITPEERVLAAKFGDEYTAYVARVPRWL